MLSETLTEGLASYGIGQKLRQLRWKKKMGLVELGRHTGLSPALISKIETGRMFPTLPTLLRTSMVFGVGLEHFFERDDSARHISIVRRAERRRFPDNPSGKDVAYHFESLDFPATNRRMNAFYAEFDVVDPSLARPHAHPGAELLYVIRGRLVLTLGPEEHVLDAGDSAYFDCTLPHSYRRKGSPACSAVVVVAP